MNIDVFLQGIQNAPNIDIVDVIVILFGVLCFGIIPMILATHWRHKYYEALEYKYCENCGKKLKRK